jgi:hypothetical protein
MAARDPYLVPHSPIAPCTQIRDMQRAAPARPWSDSYSRTRHRQTISPRHVMQELSDNKSEGFANCKLRGDLRRADASDVLCFFGSNPTPDWRRKCPGRLFTGVPIIDINLRFLTVGGDSRPVSSHEAVAAMDL